MKTNAIIRIIIWSVVILVLLAVLGVGIGFRGLQQRWDRISESPAATHVPQKLEETQPTGTASALAPTTNSSPSPAASAGTQNVITYQASSIRDISIEWVAGSISVVPTTGDTIRIYETGDTQQYPMVVSQKKDKLDIQYSSESKISFGINFNFNKDLTIEIPKDFLLQELDIDAASATVLVQDMTIQEVEFDGASGQCEFRNCNIQVLDVDTASGDIHFTGSLSALECDAASANFVGVLSNVPRYLEMESMSGNLDMTLPADAGFSVTMNGMNSDFTSDFNTTTRNNTHIHGDGACRIEMEAMNGDVIVRKP